MFGAQLKGEKYPQPLTMLLLPAAAAAAAVVVVAPPLRDERLLPGVAVFLAAARARPLPLLVALEAPHRPVGEVLQGGAPRRHLEGRISRILELAVSSFGTLNYGFFAVCAVFFTFSTMFFWTKSQRRTRSVGSAE